MTVSSPTKGTFDYEKHYKWAKGKLQKIEESRNNSKRNVILKLAEKLENSGMLVESICANISYSLSKEGYVSDRYVRDVLKETKYKRKYENKDMEDIGTASESQGAKGSDIIAVSNKGTQIPCMPKDYEEEKLANVSDLIGLGRAIDDRDNKIKELNQKIEDLKNQGALAGKLNDASPESKGEANVIESLKKQLDGANMEIEFLKEHVSFGIAKVTPKLYVKLKHTTIEAIRKNLPAIRIQYEGDEVTEIDTN